MPHFHYPPSHDIRYRQEQLYFYHMEYVFWPHILRFKEIIHSGINVKCMSLYSSYFGAEIHYPTE